MCDQPDDDDAVDPLDWYDLHEDEVREEMAIGERDKRGRWIDRED